MAAPTSAGAPCASLRADGDGAEEVEEQVEDADDELEEDRGRENNTASSDRTVVRHTAARSGKASRKKLSTSSDVQVPDAGLEDELSASAARFASERPRRCRRARAAAADTEASRT